MLGLAFLVRIGHFPYWEDIDRGSIDGHEPKPVTPPVPFLGFPVFESQCTHTGLLETH